MNGSKFIYIKLDKMNYHLGWQFIFQAASKPYTLLSAYFDTSAIYLYVIYLC